VTSAYAMGRKPLDIMESTGHKSMREMSGYIRRAGLIEESAGRGLIDEAMSKRTAPVEIADPESLLSAIEKGSKIV